MAEKKTSRREEANLEKQKAFLCENLSFAGKEAYKRLRTNVQFSFADGESSHIVGVTSAQPSDGKSTSSINLAYSMAQLGKKVLIVDADMRRSSVHLRLGIEAKPGLSNLLTDVNNVGSAVQVYEPSDGSEGFDVLPAGDVPPNPSELLGSERMERLLGKLANIYDFIVIDLPPVGAVVDAQTVSKLVDGMLVVVRENHCARSVMDSCIRELSLTGTKILGFIVNGSVAGASKSGSYKKYGSYDNKYYNSYNSYTAR